MRKFMCTERVVVDEGLVACLADINRRPLLVLRPGYRCGGKLQPQPARGKFHGLRKEPIHLGASFQVRIQLQQAAFQRGLPSRFAQLLNSQGG